MTDLSYLSMSVARDGLKSKQFSSVELVQSYIKRMNGFKKLNAFITELPELALKNANLSDKRIKTGNSGALEGLPVGVKDLFCTEGILTTAGSHILDGFTPPYESTITQKIKDAGAVVVGKTNLDEFAMGSSNETSYYGPSINSWKKNTDKSSLVPGGSSGGSASAVSAHLCSAALGTDTGGSIRQPASFCGIVGMKPTYGRCSRWGIIAFSSSLDQAGPMTRSVRDAAVLLGVMAGFDPKDATSADLPVPNFENALNLSPKGLRIGIPSEYLTSDLNPEIKDLWDKGAKWFQDAGAEIVNVSLPYTKYALPAYYIIAPAEASSNLARYDGVKYGIRELGESLDDLYSKTRAKGFGKEVKRRIFLGTYVLSAGYYDAYYLKAQKVRQLIYQDFLETFQKVDAILTPTAPSAAFSLDRKTSDPISMYLNDIFTVPASLAGLPGISIPAGLDSDGLPLGLQLITRRWDEETLFRAANVIEESASFPNHFPELD